MRSQSLAGLLAAGLAGLSGLMVMLPLGAATDADPLGEKVGGETTVFATGRNAFSFPLANLTDEERTRFAIGNSFFRRNWVEAPASTTARDGLGPHFIARSCGGCHVQDGRGAPPDFRKGLAPEDQEEAVALLIRLSIPGVGAHGGVVPDPVYGDQLNNAAISGVKPEGQLTLRRQPVTGKFADGRRYTLQKPVYGFRQLGYGPLAKGVMFSPRIAPQLQGVGLLEAIPDSELLKNVADQAAMEGPIKGQVNRVWDDFAGEMRLGRFGWKANVASLAHQTAAAFNGDIGITSTRHPAETCTPSQKDCLAAPHGGKPGKEGGAPEPELDDKTLGDVIFYQAALGPTARRNAGDVEVQRGQRLFAQAQCAVCHRPSYVTTEGPFPAFTSKQLNGQKIHPFTDLLLHDMGPALADGRPDFAANGSQWKTPPLWGIGLLRDVNGHQRLLHDGRADGVLEAVLWHGGEAEAARNQVLKMTAAERAALVKFVESL